jgi:hypothetical protein
MDPLEAINEIAKACDGTVNEVGLLPDGSGFATMSMPLPKTHWIYKGDSAGVVWCFQHAADGFSDGEQGAHYGAPSSPQ